MKIVVLDGYTLNPGDLSWDSLNKLGECKIYDRTPQQKIIERAQGATVLLTNKTPVSAETISNLSGLKYIGLLSTGFDVVDIDAAKRNDIVVTNIPTYGTSSVAQMVFAHMLNLTQNVAGHATSVRKGEWENSKDFCFWNGSLMELNNKVLGLVGLGKIGRDVARIALAFGMKVVAYDPFIKPKQERDIVSLDLDSLLQESDFVSLHCPLTNVNIRFLNQDKIGLMKKSAFLINTSRGLLVDEEALADALNNDRIAGAGLDVLSKEPPLPVNPVLRAKNCSITPHISWATFEARARLMEIALQNIQMFMDGKPINRVN